jgi:DNA-directed RNA polymerase specialized sigma24 family protein
MDGDPAAELDRFVRERAGALLRYGYVLAGNAHDAADLTQEALARLGLAWPRYGRRATPRGTSGSPWPACT